MHRSFEELGGKRIERKIRREVVIDEEGNREVAEETTSELSETHDGVLETLEERATYSLAARSGTPVCSPSRSLWQRVLGWW